MSSELALMLIALCLLGQALFAGAETAFISASFLRLTRRARQGSRSARRVLGSLQEPESVLSTLLLGTNLFIVAGSTLATDLCLRLLGETGPVVSTAVMTVLVLVFGEVIPKTLFRYQADRLVLLVVGPLKASQRILHPAVWLLSGIARAMVRIVGGKQMPGSSGLGREEIKILVREGEQFGVLRAREGQMMRHTLSLHAVRATEIMVPASALPSLRRDDTVGEARALMSSAGVELLPVWDEARSRVVGRIDAVDLLMAPEEDRISRRVRPLGMVSAAATIETILPVLKSSPGAMAVVSDRHGHTLGLVRLGDVVDRILQGPRSGAAE
jgi:putative hemolysin